MARFEYRLPDIGEGLADVEVVKWLVRVGDTARENDPIAEVETDKAVVTIPAPASGRVVALSVGEGERLKVGAVLLTMDTDAGSAAAPGHASPTPAPASEVASPPAAPDGRAAPRAAPAVRKLAADLGVRLEDVTPTAATGRVTVDDVRRHARERACGAASSAASAALPSATETAGSERVPLRGIRRRVADAMAHSVREIPHVSGFQEFDAQGLVTLRERLRAHAAGLRLTFLPFIARAAVLTLRAHPYLNASFDAAGPAVVLKKTYGIGIATATEAGLVVPVVRHADRLNFLDLARRIDALTQAARDQRLAPEDFQGGTFTVTNVGPAGGWFGTSIIRHPEVAILGVGRIEDRAVVRDGHVIARPTLPVSLTFDHRVIDGDMGLAFLRTLRSYLEAPDALISDLPGTPVTGTPAER